MNRREATGVFREIAGNCSYLFNPDFISITDSSNAIRMESTGYEIYIKCPVNGELTQCLLPILEKHQLKLAELGNAIVIYKPK